MGRTPVSIVCGTLESLPEAFAILDSEKCKKNTKDEDQIRGIPLPIAPQTETASLPTEDRRLIRTKHMKRRIFAAAKGS